MIFKDFAIYVYSFLLSFQKEKEKQSSMEEVFLRFPHLSENIFDSLNSESLAKSKEVCMHILVSISRRPEVCKHQSKQSEIGDRIS